MNKDSDDIIAFCKELQWQGFPPKTQLNLISLRINSLSMTLERYFFKDDMINAWASKGKIEFLLRLYKHIFEKKPIGSFISPNNNLH